MRPVSCGVVGRFLGLTAAAERSRAGNSLRVPFHVDSHAGAAQRDRALEVAVGEARPSPLAHHAPRKSPRVPCRFDAHAGVASRDRAFEVAVGEAQSSPRSLTTPARSGLFASSSLRSPPTPRPCEVTSWRRFASRTASSLASVAYSSSRTGGTGGGGTGADETRRSPRIATLTAEERRRIECDWSAQRRSSQ